MKSKILNRPMFKKANKDVNPENVGIMQGFADVLDTEELDSMMEDKEEGDMDTATMQERTPKSPEILMNNLRGDMRSIDARVEELADLVGYNAAVSTPTEVLALLQPVLAAEAQQGIGSLPAAGISGQPPQGMPPSLPGGAPTGMPMPPPAAAPQTDMPAVPNTTPAGMPEAGIGTLNMAKGGLVQHFRAGSDEAGVTPVDDPATLLGLGGNYPPEMINEARARTLEFLTKRPLQTPDLLARTAERVPLYEKLLGYDKNTAQAQTLFDISRAALNYASNVDEQGQPLRGSPASRAARAFANIPARMGERLGEKAKLEQGVKLAAVQASEKEIADIREQNLKLLEQQRQGWRDIAKGTTSGTFGAGKEGRTLDYMFKYAPGYAKGTLSEDQRRLFETSVTDYTQPQFIQYTDPVTGNLQMREQRNQLPDFVRTALQTSPFKTGGVSAPAGKGEKKGKEAAAAPVVTSPAPATTDTTAAAPAPSPVAGTTDQGTAPPAPSIPNYTRKDALTVRPQLISYFTSEQPTMFGAAGRGTGVPSAVGSFFYKTPLVGSMIGSKEASEARDFIENSVNRINSSLANSPRFAETERQQIQSQLDLMPKLWDNPTAYRTRLFTLDDYLIRLQDQAIETAFNSQIPVKQRQEAREKATIIHNVRENIGSPLRIDRVDDPRLQLVPPGTIFLWNGTEWRRTQPRQ